MSDPIVFTIDCTDRFYELDASVSPKDMFNKALALPSNKFFVEKLKQFDKKMLDALPTCTELQFDVSHPQEEVRLSEEEFKKIKLDETRKIEFTVKAPLSNVEGKATLFYCTVPKNYVTDALKENYQVSDSIACNNKIYSNPKTSYVLVKEGQTISFNNFQLLNSEEYDVDVVAVPGDRPAYISLNVVEYCPDHKQEYTIRGNILLGSKEAIKNVPLKEAQKMFGIKSTDKKTGMLDFTSPKNKKCAFVSPTQRTQTAAILGG